MRKVIATRAKPIQSINAAMSIETALRVRNRKHRNVSIIPKIGNKFIMPLEGKLNASRRFILSVFSFIFLFGKQLMAYVVCNTENMEYVKTINTRRFWHCADFVVVCFGRRQVSSNEPFQTKSTKMSENLSMFLN